MTTLEVLEHRLAALEQEVADLRVQVRDAGGVRLEERARVTHAPAPPPPARPSIAPRPAPRRAEPEQPAKSTPRRRAKTRRELDFSKLFGAFGLAAAGGIVTVLGIVFFFVLATNRGWINPELRLLFGAAASVGVFAAGFWLRRRFGTTHAALAAAGAGIAGAYATVLAATALYGFVPELGALVAAAAIAAVATVVAVSWKAELVAALGLIGALLVPLMTLFEHGELTLIGTSFVAVVFTATAGVALLQRWRLLLVTGILASFPQIAGLVAQGGVTDWAVVWLSALFWALFVATAVGVQVTAKARIAPLAATLVLAAAALAAFASARLFDGDVGGWSRAGLALLAVSCAYLALGAAFLLRRRDFATLLWGVGLTLGAAAGAVLLSGSWLAVAWAGEAAVLAWLGDVTRERRFSLASVGYLLLALAFTLGHEAPFDDLFQLSRHPAIGAPSVLAVAAAALAVAWFCRRPPEELAVEGPLGSLLAGLTLALHRGRSAFVWLAGGLVLYAASLGVLELAAWLGEAGPRIRFEQGHVAVTGLWALVAVGLVEVGGRLRRLDLQIGGLGLVALATVKAVRFDLVELDTELWALAFFLVAAGALIAGFEYQRLGVHRWSGLRPEALSAVLASVLLGGYAVVEPAAGSWNGIDVVGGGLLLLALPYALLSAAVLRASRLRDLATVLWSIPLTLAGAALFLLLDAFWLVLALTAASALLSLLAHAVREPRFQVPSALYLLAALVSTLAYDAPPRDLVVASQHPAGGAPSLVLVGLAGVVFGLFARHPAPAVRPPFSWSQTVTLAGLLGALRSWQSTYRVLAYAGAGIVFLYALSLSILELAELLSGAGVETDFQRGHTAVSAAWGAIGLCLLTLGLIRGSRSLRLAGFALYGISIVKLFLYDLTYSSPMGRPLSFLAVGILLLASGFFYQRLSERMEERGSPTEP
jgi:uncharacterized membrane protein